MGSYNVLLFSLKKNVSISSWLFLSVDTDFEYNKWIKEQMFEHILRFNKSQNFIL